MDFAGKKLLVFGDSIMYGSGNNGVGVGEYLAEKYGFSLKKYCVGGARVGFYAGKNWLVEQVRTAISNNEKADFLIFDGFTNDCNKTDGINCDVFLGEYQQEKTCDIFSVDEGSSFTDCFVAVAKAFKKYFGGAKILFVRPHKMGRRDSEQQRIYGDRAAEICKIHGIETVDIYNDSDLDTFNEDMRDKYTFDSYGWGRGDATHPNEICYKEKYLPLIEKALNGKY